MFLNQNVSYMADTNIKHEPYHICRAEYKKKQASTTKGLGKQQKTYRGKTGHTQKAFLGNTS